MSLEEQLLEVVRALPPEQQAEVLDFAGYLRQKHAPARATRSLRGAWADLGIDLSLEDFEENRREMWANFPREFLEVDTP